MTPSLGLSRVRSVCVVRLGFRSILFLQELCGVFFVGVRVCCICVHTGETLRCYMLQQARRTLLEMACVICTRFVLLFVYSTP